MPNPHIKPMCHVFQHTYQQFINNLVEYLKGHVLISDIMTDEKTSILNIDSSEFKDERHKSCIIIEGDQIGRIFYLSEGKNIVGRMENTDINLDSSTVSRRHAVINFDNHSRIFIKDLTSSNGTYVNGQRITETELKEGDIFTIGIYKLKIASLSKHDAAFFQHMTDSAEKDALTGTYNKGSITEMLNTIIAQAAEAKQLLSIAMIDIDHFKRINDTYGHIAGDTVLKHIARLFSTYLRSTDKCGRFGGEEFLIIFKMTSIREAADISGRIQKTIMDHPPVYENKRIEVTVSIGVESNENKEINNAEAFIKLADKKLYTAKENGRNRIVY